ncbi:MAG: hypothetical protein H6722_14655 [Sandaracinus sp.]|nr:hypothetical protein [Sandaracinus sp.]
MTWKTSRLGVAFVVAFCVACGGGKSDPIPAPDGDILLPDGGFAPADIRNPVLVQTVAPEEVRAGDVIAVSCVIIDDRGEEFSSRGRTPRIRVAPEASVEIVAADIVAAIAGEVEVSCSFPDLMLTDESPAIVRILPGPAAAVTTTVDRAQVEAGDSVNVRCDVEDAYGNAILDAMPGVALDPADPGNGVEDAVATFTRAGIYGVACELAGAVATTERVEVLPSLPAALALSKVPDQPVYATGQVVEVAAVVTDRFDNVVPDAVVGMVSAPAADATLGTNRFRYFEDGTYVVTATVAPPTQDDVELTGQVTIVVNGNGPQIQCTGPRDGDMIVAAPGSTVMVTGTVDDASGVSEVRVNGALATLDGGSFRADVTTEFGINFVDVVARDSFGTESTATCAFLASARYADPGSTLGDVVSLKLRQEAFDDMNRGDGLDSLNDILHSVLNSAGLRSQLDSTLRAMNPLYNNCEASVFGACVLRVTLNYNNEIRISGATSTLQLVNGGLRASIAINELRAAMRLTNPVNTSGWAIFEGVNMDVTFDVALVAGRPRITVRPGTTSVSIRNVRTDLSGFAGWIIDNILLPIFRGSVRNAIQNTLRDYIQNNFNDVLDGVVAGLDIESLGTSLSVPRLDGSGNIPLSFGVGFSSVSTTSSRFLVGIGSRFTAPVQIARPTLGVAVPPGVASGSLRDDPSLTQSTSVSIHSVLFNQVTHALWRAGLLQGRITGSGLGGGLPAGLVADLDGGLPPVAILTDEGRAEIGIGSLNLSLVYPGLFDEPINLTLGARASTTVRLVGGSDLSFDAITVDELFFSTQDVSLDAATRDVLERFLTTLVQSIVDRVLNDALPALPIPSFELPSSLSTYGIPAGTSLGLRSPNLAIEPQHFVLRGNFGSL